MSDPALLAARERFYAVSANLGVIIDAIAGDDYKASAIWFAIDTRENARMQLDAATKAYDRASKKHAREYDARTAAR